jgi:hypothetical protein
MAFKKFLFITRAENVQFLARNKILAPEAVILMQRIIMLILKDIFENMTYDEIYN